MPHPSRPSPSQRTCSSELCLWFGIYSLRCLHSRPQYITSSILWINKKIQNTKELAAQFTWYGLRGLSGSAVFVLMLLCPRGVESSTPAESIVCRTLKISLSICSKWYAAFVNPRINCINDWLNPAGVFTMLTASSACCYSQQTLLPVEQTGTVYHAGLW